MNSRAAEVSDLWIFKIVTLGLVDLGTVRISEISKYCTFELMNLWITVQTPFERCQKYNVKNISNGRWSKSSCTAAIWCILWKKEILTFAHLLQSYFAHNNGLSTFCLNRNKIFYCEWFAYPARNLILRLEIKFSICEIVGVSNFTAPVRKLFLIFLRISIIYGLRMFDNNNPSFIPIPS